MTGFSLAMCRRALTLAAVTSRGDTQFDAIDEAFFHAADADSPASERPVTLELEAEDSEADQGPPDRAESERLRARRAGFTQMVVEIVATLALVSSAAFGMNLVRGSAGSAGALPDSGTAARCGHAAEEHRATQSRAGDTSLSRAPRHCDFDGRRASRPASDSATPVRLPIGKRSAPGS